MSEEGLQIAEESRDGKGKGERERYTQLNAQLQRLASKDKKAFSGEQWNEIEGNNRMGKARDLFRKIGDIKGAFHSRMVTIKDRMGRTEQRQKRLRRGVKNTEKNFTKDTTLAQETTLHMDIARWSILKWD